MAINPFCDLPCGLVNTLQPKVFVRLTRHHTEYFHEIDTGLIDLHPND